MFIVRQITSNLQIGLFNYTGLSVRAWRKVHEGISVLFITECQGPLWCHWGWFLHVWDPHSSVSV